MQIYYSATPKKNSAKSKETLSRLFFYSLLLKTNSVHHSEKIIFKVKLLLKKTARYQGSMTEAIK